MGAGGVKLLDLFSGIGGFSLGLEAAGFETVAFCEISAPCRRLLAHHWPKVPCYEDIKDLTADRLARDGITVDAICGGFPCQDISVSNPFAAGIEGARSGLWGEYARLIGELRPRIVFVENSPMLLSRGMGRVLGDLASLGYDAQWDCISGCHVGAPQIGERLWLCASPMREGWQRREQYVSASRVSRQASTISGDGFAHARRVVVGDCSGLRTDHGFSVTMERAAIHGLGNAVIPQVAEALGRIMSGALDA